MSILSDKYKVPEATIKNMIQDGLIPCTWMRYEEVFKLKSEGKSITEIADLTNMTERNVRYILRK